MEKLRPTQFSLTLGSIETAQERWAAYDKAAKKAESHSLASWAREILDREAGFKNA